MLITVGGSGMVFTSEDGITWTDRTVAVNWGGTNTIRAVAASSTRIVIGGDSGKFRYSSDGVSWTDPGEPVGTDFQSHDLLWVEQLGLFIVFGTTTGSSSAPTVATSPDGTTWTTRTNPFTATPTDSAWSVTQALALALQASGSRSTSPDGVTWSALGGTTNNPNSVAWGNGVWVVTGRGDFGSTPVLRSSPDGTTWTTRLTRLQAGAQTLQAPAYSPDLGLWFTVSQLNNPRNVYTSADDGATWTNHGAVFPGAGASTPVLDSLWSSDLGLFVAVGLASDVSVATSPDGTTWTNRHIFGFGGQAVAEFTPVALGGWILGAVAL